MASLLEENLERIHKGESALLPAALRLLAEAIVFTPVAVFVDVHDSRGTKKVKVVTLNEEGRKTVPTFTSEDFFLAWTHEEYQCLPVSGGDIALTLPPDTWLIINPGLPSELLLTPDEVTLLAKADSIVEEKAQETIINDLQSSARESDEFSDDYDSEPILAEHIEDTAFDAGPQITEDRILPMVSADEVIADLVTLFQNYPDILEAYYVESSDDQTGGVLGLLTRALPVEVRFVLMTEIGELSRKHFGYAGALEAYDDLNTPHSSSWDLFKTLAPFYVKDENDDRSVYRTFQTRGLASSVETSSSTDENSAHSGWSTTILNAIKKRKPKFFGGLTGY